MWKNAFLKTLYYKGFSEYCEILLVWANFALTHTLPLKNGSFLTKISLSQNLKVAIYKGFRISGRQKYPKNRGRNCWFFENWDAFKGTLRALKGHSWRGSKSLTNKELFLLPSLFCHDLSLQNKKSPVKGDFLSTGIPI